MLALRGHQPLPTTELLELPNDLCLSTHVSKLNGVRTIVISKALLTESYKTHDPSLVEFMQKVEPESHAASAGNSNTAYGYQLDEPSLQIDMTFEASVPRKSQVRGIREPAAAQREEIMPPFGHEVATAEGDHQLSSALGLSAEDLHDIWSWNATVPEASDIPVHALIGMTVKAYPHKTAVCAWDGDWTYGELDLVSTQLAHYLTTLDVARKVLPLCFEKSKWMPIAQLAVMKAGAASVLLDPSQPEDLLRSALEQVSPSVMLCSSNNVELVGRVYTGTVVIVDGSHPSASDAMLPTVLASDALYLQFTSGVTGKPKGSFISHRNFSSAYQHQKGFMYTTSSRVIDLASHDSDIAWSNFLFSLVGGACLCIPSEEERTNDLAQCIGRLGITHVNLTPSTLRALSDETLQTIQTVQISGEQLISRDAQHWRALTTLHNMYGSSECTPTATMERIEIETPRDSIGKGIGVCTWIVDARGELSPVGSVGELLLEGPLVGPGYLRAETTTAEFIEDPDWLLRGGPNHSGRCGRLHKTGDLVRYNTDGSLIFLGRKDLRVKINGQSVELPRVEHAVQSTLPAVTSVVADVVTPLNHPKAVLLAFLEIGKGTLSQEQVRGTFSRLGDQVARQVPAYMVPSVFVPLATFPVTVKGRTDRQNLRTMIEQQTYSQLQALSYTQIDHEPSISLSERQLQTLWSSVLHLGADSIGPNDSFLQIGGDSMEAMRLVVEAREHGFRLTVSDIMRNPRLKDMAKLVRSPDQSISGQPVQQFSLLRNSLDSEDIRRQVASLCNVPMAKVQDVFPCTPLQEGFLAMTALREGDYVERFVFELQDSVDFSRLQAAWAEVVTRTPILRTRIVDLVDQGLVQTVLDEQVPWLLDQDITDVTTHSQLEGGGEESRRSILGTRLVRFELEVEQDGRRMFGWTIHHSLFDGRTIPLILQNLHRAYAGEQWEDAPPFQGFVKHVLSIDQMQATTFWAKQLRDLEAPHFPPLPSPDHEPQACARVARQILNPQWPQTDVTPSNIIRAAWALVVSHYTNSDDVVFGATVAGCQAAVFRIESMTGPTIATVPVRTRIDKSITARAYLQEVQTQAIEMTAFEQVGLQHIRRISADAERACQFQSLLLVQPKDQLTSLEGGLLFRRLVAEGGDEETMVAALDVYGVTLTCQLDTERLDLRFDFDPDRMEAAQMSRIAAHLEHTLRQLCSPDLADTRLSTLGGVSDSDLRDIWSWNAIVPEECPGLIHERIAETVQAKPESLAVDAWDGKWSYFELDSLSSRLAGHLRSFGIDYRNRLIPLCFEKSKWTPIAMLAVMKAGGASVALDPSQPTDRLRTIMDQVQPAVILTSPAQLDVASRLAQCQVVLVEESHMAELADSEIGHVDGIVPDLSPSSILYCVFTSGSTGTPKGVLVHHTNFNSAIQHQLKWYGYNASSRVYDFASYAFDAAWVNVVATFCSGACLCIPQDMDRINDLAGSMTRMRATHADLTPSVARLLPLDIFKQLHSLFVSGEVLEPSDACRWAKLVDLKNVYGPCECTPTATIATIPADAELKEGSLIGKGVGVCTWVVDANSLVPVGGVGELFLEGPLVGMGYLGDADKSAGVFIEDPPWLLRGAPGHPGRHGRLYRTGDLVRYNMDGSLTFIGRKDTRVKINGQLVELAEVEHHIRAYEQVRQCACLVPKSGLYARRLVGVFSLHGLSREHVDESEMQALDVSGDSSVNLHIDSMRRILDRALPSYMVPAVWIALRDIPLNTSGKLDRSKLHKWLSSINAHPQHCPPKAELFQSRSAAQDDAESVLFDVCSNVLNLPLQHLDCGRSFIGNGGDSISAMRVVSRCRAASIAISVASLLQERSLAALARILVIRDSTSLSRAEDIDRPFPLSPMQRWFFAQLQPDQIRKPECHYNQSFCLRLRRRVCPSKVSKAVTKVVELHSMLRARFSYNEGVWMQRILAPSANCHSLQVVQVKNTADVAALIMERQRQIDIEKGPVFFADLSEQPDGTQHLSLVVHHLSFDLVSWRIILDDLETVLCGGSIQPCLPFQQWNKMQIAKATAPLTINPEDLLSTDGISNDLRFWEFTASTPNMQSDRETQFIEVDTDTTDLLLGNANLAFHTEPVDLLLSAIWAAFFPVFFERQGLTLWREGHGREPWSPEIDLSRTVGWFTTISPIHIASSTGTDLAGLARAVKDARRRLPANGWAYFSARYLSQTDGDSCKAHGPPVEVEFNYHGQFQQLEREESLFDAENFDHVADEGPQVPAAHLFNIEVSIQNKRLGIAVSWNRHIAHQDRIKDWMEGILPSLQALCGELITRQPSKTLCDYPFLDVGYSKLDELQQSLLPHIEAVNNSKVVEVLPCSPTVTGMLLSQSKQPQLYMTEEIYKVTATDGNLPSATSLAAAWQQVVAHQPSLRSVFTPGLDHKAAFNQVVLESSTGDVVHIDSGNEAAAMQSFAALQPLDGQQLKPPHRLTICRVGIDVRMILCQIEMSHAITDAASTDLLIRDWSCAYEGTLPTVDLLATCREVARTIATPAQDMLRYWQRKLEGTVPCYFPRLNPGIAQDRSHNDGYNVSLEIPQTLVQALGRLTHTRSVTSVSILQAAWALTLASYCGNEPVCFGYVASGRDLPIEDLDKCVGAYANMMVCRVKNAQKMSHRDLIQAVHAQMMQDLRFQQCNLAAIQHGLQRAPGQSLFNSSLNCQRVDSSSPFSNSEQRISFESIDGADPTEYDVVARVTFGDGFAGLDLATRSSFMLQKQARRVLSLYLTSIAAFTNDFTS
ncbi:MAG: Non-ribosomal peptide synthetase [Ramalina farinacea]|uniref:Non-ribosomal peptide synthetase n=1 Tax=Ramalina farinacea TaxID=258253 RepID=A0AA43QSF4_9LECA|nr:Non-ribosomal peptide synthetase [Ramalina farinacea]